MELLRVYVRVMGVLRRDRRIALGLSWACVAVAALQFLDPVLFGRVIGLLADSADMPRDQLWRQAVRLLGIWAVVGASGIVINVATVVQAERLAHRNRLGLMARFFGHVLDLPMSFHAGAHSGRMMNVMMSGVDAMFGLWLTFFRENLSTFVATIVLLPMTLLLNWRLSLSLIVLVVLYCVMTVLVVRHTEKSQQRAQSYQMALAGTAQDALANVMVLQSFTRLAGELNRFGDIVQQVIRHQFPVLNWWALVNVMTRAASTLAVMAIVVIGTLLHLDGQAEIGEIVTFMGFATMLISRLDGAMSFSTRLFLETPSIAAFFEVMDTRSSVPEAPHAARLPRGQGEVTFEDVSFTYPAATYPGGPPTLSHIAFTARPGMSVALVGHTGAGKSTAMALLQRLWDPTAGRVLIDGRDIREVTLESLRGAIGVVFQDSMLLNRSIRENVLIGKPEATEEELERACRMADAHEFIVRQAEGYETMVGERGGTLSGGQRQRLAIARALLKDPPILILDEATSALDAATEARVSRALKVLMAGRTTFIIAHRLSTVRDADEILVFESGRIVERGRFEELLAQGGRFAELVRTQLQARVEEVA
jgi:ATP-binding cassette subfamily B protein